jgi:hypothetical protein
VHWTTAGLLAIFDGDRGAFFLVLLIALLVGGVVLLIVNLTAGPKAPPQPKWEPVPDDVPQPEPVKPAGRTAAPRRRA